MPFWNRAFRIEGMVRRGIEHPAEFPEEEINIDEKMILIKNRAEPESCHAHLLVETSEGERLFDSRGNQLAEERVFNYICLYTLFTEYSGVTTRSAGASQLREAEQLGKGIVSMLSVELVFTPEDKEREEQRVRDYLSKSIEYFNRYERTLLQKPYLVNALHYYYYAINSERYEDKLIDLIIALESLYMERNRELRFKLSLRVAALIGEMYDDRTPIDVFKDMKELYDLRCDVVHGRERVEISFGQIEKLKDYTRRSIKTFISLSQTMSKEEILRLLNNSFVNTEAKEELRSLIRALGH